MTNDRAPVLVTGGSGYIAGWIVKDLLERGETVHATVRDPDKRQGLEHLHALAAAHPGKLQLFKADLLEPGSFTTAIQGCELVLHTASPFVLNGVTDAAESLVRPAVEGTRNVLEAVDRCPSVRRVVLTSSVVSMFGDAADVSAGPLTEDHWNTTSTVDHLPYSYSKTQAERAAWEIHDRQSRWSLVTINPGFVFGPSLAKASVSSSIDTMKQLAGGQMKRGAPHFAFGMADVRDVARAHVLAALAPGATGRYIISNRELSFLDVGTILRAKFGDAYPFPRKEVPKWIVWLLAPFLGLTRRFVSRNVGFAIRIDGSRATRDLGLTYRPAEDTLVEHFQQLLDDGLVARATA